MNNSEKLFILGDWLNNGNYIKYKKFYNDNPYKSPSNANLADLTLLTYNIHGLKALNLNDTDIFITSIIKLLIDHNITIVGFTEWSHKYFNYKSFKKQLNIAGFKYNTPINSQNVENVVFSKIELLNITINNLPNKQNTKRYIVSFNINDIAFEGYKFGFTHLEIGNRWRYLNSSEKRSKIINYNTKIRISQLDYISNTIQPDILFGDFNFNNNDCEYGHILKKYKTDDSNIDYTTPFGSTVDFIFYIYDFEYKYTNNKIKINLSDHLPVISYISTQTSN